MISRENIEPEISHEVIKIQAKSQMVASLGFQNMEGVGSLLSIAHLFGASKKRTGIYCLAFATGHFYIGQAIDVVRRFSEHRRNFNDIIGFAFIPTPKSKLNSIEKELIFKGEQIGLKLKNSVHVSSILGETDLDLVLPEQDQKDWLEGKYHLISSHENLNPKVILPQNQKDRFSKNFDKFLLHPMVDEATVLLQKYLSKCIPCPRTTEYSFWSVSCMPTTNQNTWPRLFCVNAASMELYVVGWKKKEPGLWSVVTVDEAILNEYWPDPEKFSAHFPGVEFFTRNYRDAGENQITLSCGEGLTMNALLSDDGVSKAAASLALRVMRKRANFYMQYHCPQLANYAFSDNPLKNEGALGI